MLYPLGNSIEFIDSLLHLSIQLSTLQVINHCIVYFEGSSLSTAIVILLGVFHSAWHFSRNWMTSPEHSFNGCSPGLHNWFLFDDQHSPEVTLIHRRTTSSWEQHFCWIIFYSSLPEVTHMKTLINAFDDERIQTLFQAMPSVCIIFTISFVFSIEIKFKQKHFLIWH